MNDTNRPRFNHASRIDDQGDHDDALNTRLLLVWRIRNPRRAAANRLLREFVGSIERGVEWDLPRTRCTCWWRRLWWEQWGRARPSRLVGAVKGAEYNE